MDVPATPMPELGLLTVTAADGRDLLTAAQADWSRPVPDCPGWTAADLVGHMGAILGWMAKIVTTGEAVPRRERETPPAGRDALAAWYTAHLDRTLSILTAAAADAPHHAIASEHLSPDERIGRSCHAPPSVRR